MEQKTLLKHYTTKKRNNKCKYDSFIIILLQQFLWWFLLKKKTNKKNANMIHIISVMMNDVKGKSDMGKEDEGTTTSTIDRSAIVASLWIILR